MRFEKGAIYPDGNGRYWRVKDIHNDVMLVQLRDLHSYVCCLAVADQRSGSSARIRMDDGSQPTLFAHEKVRKDV